MQRKLKIIRCNKIKCKKCNDIIESTYVHDFKWCMVLVMLTIKMKNIERLGNKQLF